MRDPVQYARFSDERSRPFFNLLERVPQRPFQTIVVLGCGAGELTVALAERWPEAHVTGLDNSPQMLAKSGRYVIPDRLNFVEQNVVDYDTPTDLIYANATLQWVDDHATVFPRLASLINPGGALAVQMPFSHVQPSHLLMEEMVRTGSWAPKLVDWHRFQVQPLPWYAEMLIGLGFDRPRLGRR